MTRLLPFTVLLFFLAWLPGCGDETTRPEDVLLLGDLGPLDGARGDAWPSSEDIPPLDLAGEDIPASKDLAWDAPVSEDLPAMDRPRGDVPVLGDLPRLDRPIEDIPVQDDLPRLDRPREEDLPRTDLAKQDVPVQEDFPRSDRPREDVPVPEDFPRLDRPREDIPVPEDLSRMDRPREDVPVQEDFPRMDRPREDIAVPEDFPRLDQPREDIPVQEDFPRLDRPREDIPPPEDLSRMDQPREDIPVPEDLSRMDLPREDVPMPEDLSRMDLPREDVSPPEDLSPNDIASQDALADAPPQDALFPDEGLMEDISPDADPLPPCETMELIEPDLVLDRPGDPVWDKGFAAGPTGLMWTGMTDIDGERRNLIAVPISFDGILGDPMLAMEVPYCSGQWSGLVGSDHYFFTFLQDGECEFWPNVSIARLNPETGNLDGPLLTLPPNVAWQGGPQLYWHMGALYAVWKDSSEDPDGRLCLQSFDEDLNALMDISILWVGDAGSHELALDGDDGLLLWEERSASDQPYNVFIAKISSTGTMLSQPTQISSAAPDLKIGAAFLVFTGNWYVVGYLEMPEGSTNYNTIIQRYDRDGLPLGSHLIIPEMGTTRIYWDGSHLYMYLHSVTFSPPYFRYTMVALQIEEDLSSYQELDRIEGPFSDGRFAFSAGSVYLGFDHEPSKIRRWECR